MCFMSKVKTPKTDPEAVKAPTPVLLDEVKGVDFGAGTDVQASDPTGIDVLKVRKSDVTASDKGDGSSTATAADTGVSTVKPKSAPVIKKALKKVTK